MTQRLFAKTVAAGLIVMVAGTARAQGGEGSGAVTKLQIPQLAVTNTMAHTNRPAAAAELRSLPTVWPPQPYSGFPNNSRNSRSRQVLARVAIGVMAAIVGASIADAAGLRFGR